MQDAEVITVAVRKLILPGVRLCYCCQRQSRYKCSERMENVLTSAFHGGDVVSKNSLRNQGLGLILPQAPDFPLMSFFIISIMVSCPVKGLGLELAGRFPA